MSPLIEISVCPHAHVHEVEINNGVAPCRDIRDMVLP